MSEDSDPPRRPQPFLDLLRLINGLKRSPLGQQQQAELARLRDHLQQGLPDLNRLRDMLSMPQDEAERFRARLAPPSGLANAIKEAHEQLQREEAEAAGTPSVTPEPTPSVTPEPAASTAPEPESVSENVAADKTTEPGATQIQRKKPKQWAADWMKTNPQGEGEGPGEYAQRMHDDMVKAPDVTEPRDFEYCRRALYREPKEVDFEPEPGSVQTFPKHH
jgi:hypothetical protein